MRCDIAKSVIEIILFSLFAGNVELFAKEISGRFYASYFPEGNSRDFFGGKSYIQHSAESFLSLCHTRAYHI